MSLDGLKRILEQKRKDKCYEPRIQSLKKLGRDTSLIENGISDVLQVLGSETRSFVIYGEPQSGKTEFMIALTCKLIDEGYQTIFIIMNDSTELEQQNFDRFRGSVELNPSPKRDFEITGLSPEELKKKRQRIIFCRKNASNLTKLIEATRHMTGRVVIDDEADYATPNAKISRDEVTKINYLVGQLGQLEPDQDGIYIGVTATPGRLDLNNTFANDAKKWVFLESHGHYKGRSFFFPSTTAEENVSDYQLVALPDEGDDPKYLRHSVIRFLVRVAALNLKGEESEPYSMLIHTSGKKHDHEADENSLRKILANFQEPDESAELVLKESIQIASDLVALHRLDFSPEELVAYVIHNIGKLEILVINHQNDSKNVDRACNPASLFTFAIGGNIVSRGLTFNRLLTFFFSRNVKSKLQQNTYIQRARMFGVRGYSKFFELCVPKALFDDWADCFVSHELSLRTAKAGHYVHVEKGRTSAADKGAIDKYNVTRGSGERPAGDKFKLSNELERRLLEHDGKRTISFLIELVREQLIPEEAIAPDLLQYIRETSGEDETEAFLVLRSKPRALHNIERHKDADPETITRTRGGMVQALIKGSSEYENKKHYILPVRNQAGDVRFFYRNNLGHVVLQNKARKPIHRLKG